MKKLFSNYIFNFLFILTLTLLGLWFALYDSYKTVFATVSAMPLWRVGIMIFWGMAPQLVYGVILMIMARSLKQKYPYRHGLVNALIGSFVSGITPSATGGQFAQALTFKKQGLSTTQGAGLVWMDFYINEVVLVAVTLFLFILKMANFRSPAITFLFAIALLVNGAIIAILWIMVEYPKLYHIIFEWVITLLGKMRFIKHKEKIIDGWNNQMVHFHAATEAVAGNKVLVIKIAALYVLRLVIYFTTPYIIALLLGFHVTFSQFVEFLALASFVSMANTFVPLPGASGATEGLFVLVFSTVIGKAGAASMMIFWRFTTFYVPLLVGGYIFIRRKRSKQIVTTEEIEKDPE
jgi:glycosyltransferase 2 family protein